MTRCATTPVQIVRAARGTGASAYAACGSVGAMRDTQYVDRATCGTFPMFFRSVVFPIVNGFYGERVDHVHDRADWPEIDANRAGRRLARPAGRADGRSQPAGRTKGCRDRPDGSACWE